MCHGKTKKESRKCEQCLKAARISAKGDAFRQQTLHVEVRIAWQLIPNRNGYRKLFCQEKHSKEYNMLTINTLRKTRKISVFRQNDLLFENKPRMSDRLSDIFNELSG